MLEEEETVETDQDKAEVWDHRAHTTLINIEHIGGPKEDSQHEYTKAIAYALTSIALSATY